MCKCVQEESGLSNVANSKERTQYTLHCQATDLGIQNLSLCMRDTFD